MNIVILPADYRKANDAITAYRDHNGMVRNEGMVASRAYSFDGDPTAYLMLINLPAISADRLRQAKIPHKVVN